MKNIGALTDSFLREKGYMYSYGVTVPPYIQREILIKKCFIDQKGLKAASVYSHCTPDPGDPYHYLLAPVTETSLPAWPGHPGCGKGHPVRHSIKLWRALGHLFTTPRLTPEPPS